MSIHAGTSASRLPETACELFGVHLDRFRQHLINQNHAEHTVRQYSRCICAIAGMMKAEGIVLDDLDEGQTLALVARAG